VFIDSPLRVYAFSERKRWLQYNSRAYQGVDPEKGLQESSMVTIFINNDYHSCPKSIFYLDSI